MDTKQFSTYGKIMSPMLADTLRMAMTTARLDGSGIESLAHAASTVYETIDDCMKKLCRS